MPARFPYVQKKFRCCFSLYIIHFFDFIFQNGIPCHRGVECPNYLEGLLLLVHFYLKKKLQ